MSDLEEYPRVVILEEELQPVSTAIKRKDFLPFFVCGCNGNDDFGISSISALPLSKIVFESQIEELCGGKIFGLCPWTIHSQFR